MADQLVTRQPKSDVVLYGAAHSYTGSVGQATGRSTGIFDTPTVAFGGAGSFTGYTGTAYTSVNNGVAGNAAITAATYLYFPYSDGVSTNATTNSIEVGDYYTGISDALSAAFSSFPTTQIRGIQVNAIFGKAGGIVTPGAQPNVNPTILFDINGFGVLNAYGVNSVDIVPGNLIADVNLGTASLPLLNYLGAEYPGVTSWQGFRQLSPGDLANLYITMEAFNPNQPMSELRIASIGMNVYFNVPPTSTVTILNNTAGVVNTTTPIVRWAYTDPEGDQQAGYRIVVYKQSDAASLPGTLTESALSTYSRQPVYDTGRISSASALSVPIPFGYLQNFTTYRVFVFVTDQGSNNRYNTLTNSGTVTSNVGALNAGFDMTVEIEPILMPAIEFYDTVSNPGSSFNPLTGAIGPIGMRARVNLLSQVSGDFTSGGSGNIGGWALNNQFISNAGSTQPVVTLTGSGPSFNAAGSPGLTTSGNYAASSEIVPITAGLIYTGELKYWTSFTRTIQVGIQWFTDAAGTVPHSITPISLSTSYPTNLISGLAIKAFVQAKAPARAKTARLTIISTTASTGIVRWYQAALTNGTLNLLDDASFEQATVSNQFSWIAGTSYSSPSLASASYAQSNDSSHLAASATTGPSYQFFPGNNAAIVWTYALDAATPGGGSIQMVFAAYSPTATTTGTPTRFTGAFSGATWGASAYQPTYSATGLASDIDNVQLEQFWPFSSGSGTGQLLTTSGWTNGWTLAASVVLGLPTVLASPITGQFWTWGNTVLSASTAALSNAQNRVTNDLSILLSCTGSSDYIEQIFSVSGFSQIVLKWYWGGQHTSDSATLQFFDSAGIEISQSGTANAFNSPVVIGTLANPGSSFGGWSAQQTYTAAVPTNAAYARWAFINNWSEGLGSTGLLYINDCTMTPTGTNAVSTPWMDGGFSQGIGTIVGGAADSESPLDVQLIHSPTVYPVPNNPSSLPANAGYVRQPPSAGVVGALVSGNEEYDFIDYEYPAADNGTSQTIYYLGYTILPNGEYGAASQQIAITNAASFAPSNWVLVDPLIPADNVVLNVKKAQFKQSENQSILMPAGRGRKVVVGDTQIFGDSITLDLLTTSIADYDALKKQYQKVYPLLLRAPSGEMWFVRLTDRSREWVWQGTYAKPYRTYTITMEQVDAVS